MADLSLSIMAYNDDLRAERYNQQQGFDPTRKDAMLRETRQLLVDLTPPRARLLELGAGTGHFTRYLIESGHFASVLVTDGAPAMLNRARQSLAPESATTVEFALLDFEAPSWNEVVTSQPFDAVTGSMTFHHADDKTRLFRKVHDSIAPEGVFVFADHMAEADDRLTHLVDLKRARMRLGNDASPEDVEAFIARDRAGQLAQGNRCESVESYLRCLRAAGFKAADCLWRDGWLAVFVALKVAALW